MENLLAQPSRHYETDFVLAQLGHSVGLAAFWRFPYLCHENGGGSFIVSYVFLLFAMGFPLIFMEMALGQNLHFSGWKQIHPRMWGLNLATCLISFMLLLYYNAVIAWSIFYLGNSFLCPLPWSQCPVGANGTSEVLECVRTRPSIYFWFRETLMVTGSIEEGGGLVFSLTVCLLVVWVSILFIWLQGLQAKGKVLYLSVLGPYVVLMYFLIQSCLLEGSIFGMLHFIQIKKSLITSTKVWRQAGAQMFISTGLGIGNIIFLYSCATKNNCAQDAFMLTFTHMASCLLTTQVIFSMLGFQAAILTRKCVLRNSWKLLDLIARGVLPLEATPPKDLNKKAVQSYAMWLEQLNSDLRKKVLEHVAECNMEDELRRSKQGPGLVFVAFTEAVTSFPGSSFWAVLFFLLLISQGLNVSVSQLQGTLTLLQDIFPSLSNFSLTISVTYCCLGFLCSLLFTQRSGLYFLKLFDEILATLPLIIMIFFETVGVAWIYGAKRFLDEVWAMLEFKIKLMHEYVLRYYTLLGVMILIIISLLDFIMEQPTYQAWDSSTALSRKHLMVA
ncbi:orphan sodium- and chloride-dependent neurotransmitter transporter NTT5 isoform X2 [Monodelphis domestica]|uniref:orphan sodium- and chloride-dependent neurotransmitter transporter NTT5 isoform X2 n=1 Tax=Monodelphis domestica TaxID=13616 RepID=UPI0024E22583|nr:orphan sodium- and chloride-dependent neurotransmitter transporter NTT5 isoform X2 [Monodelphis domestica]